MFTVKLIKEALETLQIWLGLIANRAKSSFYLSCARNDTRKKLRGEASVQVFGCAYGVFKDLIGGQ